MNREQAIENVATALLQQHGLYQLGWRFGWNTRRRAFGLCTYEAKTIELSSYLFALSTDQSAHDTVLHELAHAIAPRNSGHGPRWKAACRLVGAKPERCKQAANALTEEGMVTFLASMKYSMTCPTCGYTCGQSRKPSRLAGCGRCYKATRQHYPFVVTLNR